MLKIFHKIQLSFLLIISLTLLCSFLILTSISQAAELQFKGGSIKMPANPKEYKEDDIDLPWGKATQENYEAKDPATDIIYHFATFTFSNPTKTLNLSGLRKVKKFFLKNRGCVATTLKEDVFLDANKHAWPQTTFEGVCKAPVRFQITVLIAENQVFWFEVYRNGISGIRLEKGYLTKTLNDFISSFILKSN